MREDIPLAKQLQDLEKERIQAQRSAAARPKPERVLSLGQQPQQQQPQQPQQSAERDDEEIAKQIQRRLWVEEERARRLAEEADERLAQKLEQKEKARQLRKRAQKEKEQVEKLTQQIGADYGLESGQLSSSPSTPPSLSSPSFQRILTEDEQELDLSEFCMPPPPGLTPEELKFFLEDQDAEIARLLQHQELKRNKNPEKEKLAVIEAQDFELARMLQRMEKDRVRRIREKMRARQQRTREAEDGAGPSFASMAHLEPENYQRTSTPISPHSSFEAETRPVENEYDIPENHLLQGDTESITYEEPYQLLSQASEARQKQQQSFHNIAMDLDPTYQRRSQAYSSTSPLMMPGHSASNLLESCVDDGDEMTTAGSPQFGALIRPNDSLEKLHRTSNNRADSAGPVTSSTSSSRSSRTSASSRHSGDSRGQRSDHSASARGHQQHVMMSDDYAPPLPPRDNSLLSRHRAQLHQQSPSPPAARSSAVATASAVAASTPPPLPPPLPSADSKPFASSPPTGTNYQHLPPHHPQHPNRRSHGADTGVPSPSNRSSIYSVTSANMPIQGQRRIASMEKPKKEKHKGQDGCKTQWPTSALYSLVNINFYVSCFLKCQNVRFLNKAMSLLQYLGV